MLKGIELHLFCDVSLTGYSACAYFRVEYDDGFVQCLFALGKARVAPSKPVTVPRLELTAAVIAVKVAFIIRSEVEFYFDCIVFWCDATAVLRYINNTSSRYKSFEANRLELIHTLSSPKQWTCVSSSLNAADIGSRGVISCVIDSADIWF